MDRTVSESVRSNRRLRLWAAVGAALLVLGLVLVPVARRWLQSDVSVDGARIRTGTATRGDLVRELAVQGNVVAAFHPTLFSPSQGIARLLVQAGEPIASGEVLARVESPQLTSRLQQERSNLLAMEAEHQRQRILARQVEVQANEDIGLLEVELEAAERAMNRAERSRQQGILNEVEYEAAQDAVRISSLRLDLARKRTEFEIDSAALETANRLSQVERQRLVVQDLVRQVEELEIRSPVAGVVSRLLIDDQDAVVLGSPIVSVVDLSAFELEVAVPEIYADEIGPHVEAVITYDGRSYAGRVKSLSPEVEGSRVEGRVAFVDAPPPGLKQNQRLSTRLVLETARDVVKVPRGPFVEDSGGRRAYLIEDGIARLVPVEVGGMSLSEIEIRAGLEPGDRIIVSDTTRFNGAETVMIRE